MRLLFTSILFIGILTVGCSAVAENANTTSTTIWGKPPLEILNRDVLALPEVERRAFVHGAMAQMAVFFSTDGRSGGRCVKEWFFTVGDGEKAAALIMEKYPDYPTVTALTALARKACPELKG